jgi:hypothetical protein
MDSFKRAVTRLLIVVVVLGLLGAVGFLLSQLNARTFTLEDQNGSLVVLKGRELPMGADPYRPPDPSLVDAYAAIPLDGMPVDPAVLQQRFTERDELDRSLFEVLQRLAGPRVTSDDPATLERGFYFLKRAEKLGGITPDQRSQLQKMKADVAYYQGRLKLDEARKLLGEGLAQLHVAADSQNKHSRSANQMVLAVEPAGKALEDALREAVNQLSTPPPAPPPPAAPPAAPAAAPETPKKDAAPTTANPSEPAATEKPKAEPAKSPTPPANP